MDFLLNFNNCLLNNNFFKIKTPKDKNIYLKKEGTNGYVVVPVLKEEDYTKYFDNISTFCIDILKNKNLSKVFIVKILITDTFDNYDNDFLNYELNLDNHLIQIVWGVDLLNKKIITKNNQPTKFFNIEKYINTSFNTEEKLTKNIKQNYIVSKNSYITYSFMFIMALVYIIINTSPILDKNIINHNFGISPTLFKDKQFYRLFTFMFLHASLTHLLSNLLSLYIFGTRIERYLGKISFLAIFLIGGLFSGIFSFIFTKTYSVGASGAIFGLIGATLYFSIKEKVKLDGLDYYTIGIMCIISILGSFAVPNVDNAGHIGGFLIGYVVCYFVYNFWYVRVFNTLYKNGL